MCFGNKHYSDFYIGNFSTNLLSAFQPLRQNEVLPMFLHLPPHLQQLNTALVLSERLSKDIVASSLLHILIPRLLWDASPGISILFHLKLLVFQDICRSSLLLLCFNLYVETGLQEFIVPCKIPTSMTCDFVVILIFCPLLS